MEQVLAYISLSFLFLVTLTKFGILVCVNNEKLNIFGKIGTIIALSRTTGFLPIRWISSNHFPLSNLYESSMFLSWSLTLIHLLVGSEEKNVWLGLVTAPSAMLAHGFVTLSLPREMQESISLVPALQSHWSMMHVTTMILSYAALLCGSLLAITLLVVTATKRKNFALMQYYKNPFFDSSIPASYTDRTGNDSYSHESQRGYSFVNFRKWQLIEELNNWSYRIISLGSPLSTVGILSGAVWANEAWGSYWNRDPKETWALITWLVFATYLHTRITKGWRGKGSAIIASSGFFIIRIRYLGVNLLARGLHSYGWVLQDRNLT